MSRLSLFDRKSLSIIEGDKIRWTDNDHKRGLFNAGQARIVAIDTKGVLVETSAGKELRLSRGDPMLKRMDLAYALNAHMAQGLTSDRGIAVMDSRERNLANRQTFLVTVTRLRDGLTLIADNAEKLGRAIKSNSGEKASALEVTQRLKAAAAGLSQDKDVDALRLQVTGNSPRKGKPPNRYLMPTAWTISALPGTMPVREKCGALPVKGFSRSVAIRATTTSLPSGIISLAISSSGPPVGVDLTAKPAYRAVGWPTSRPLLLSGSIPMRLINSLLCACQGYLPSMMRSPTAIRMDALPNASCARWPVLAMPEGRCAANRYARSMAMISSPSSIRA